MRRNIKLPDTLSGLLRVAVEDAKKAQKDPRYTLDMSVWHVPNGTCEVCMAGAVMAFRGRVSERVHVDSSDYPDATWCKLEAINDLRMGLGHYAYSDLFEVGWTCDEALRANEICAPIRKAFNRVTLRAPWHVYLRVVKALEKDGL